MKASEFFPSRFLNGDDIEASVKALIVNVTIEDMPDGARKLCLWFDPEALPENKGLVLNKTNYKNLERAFGDETENWIGKLVTLKPVEVNYRGETVMGIRVTA